MSKQMPFHSYCCCAAGLYQFESDKRRKTDKYS